MIKIRYIIITCGVSKWLLQCGGRVIALLLWEACFKHARNTAYNAYSAEADDISVAMSSAI